MADTPYTRTAAALAALDPLARAVTQDCGTEPPFRNAYWNHAEAGLYVDVVSGEPLFASTDKYDSGSGWPSFVRPVQPAHIVERSDDSHGMRRVEVRSRHGDSHLGHVFDDGPAPSGLRYCINSAALRFVPARDLAAQGYGDYVALFDADDVTATVMPQTAVLAGGCFWGMQHLLRGLPGVLRTRAGYSGGDKDTAHYGAVSGGQTGHAEAVEVVFDPRVLSYRDVVLFFFRIHDPTTPDRQGNDAGTHYRSAIFAGDATQAQVAAEVIADVTRAGLWHGAICTQVVRLRGFYPAEDEHQDYLEKNPQGYTCHWVRPAP